MQELTLMPWHSSYHNYSVGALALWCGYMKKEYAEKLETLR